jgi:hypothetical protein
MEGKASTWFQELKSSGSLSSWEEFFRAIKIRFGKGSYDDPMENITNLKQVGSLEDYKTLATKVHALPDFHKLSMFLGGLRDEIRFPVCMFNPKTLIDAYSLARIQEESVRANRRLLRPAWNNSSFNQSYLGVNTDSVGGFSKGSVFNGPRMNMSTQPRQPNSQSWAATQGGKERGNQGKTQPLVPIQKITQFQMEDRRKKGLCYTCDSKWVRGHVCSVPKLFLIEAVPEDSNTGSGELPQEEVDPSDFFFEEFLEISLNAIIGTPSPKTMRLVGIVQFHSLTILIDSGSTHNFLDVKFATSLGFKPLQGDVISVRVANGQKVSSPGSCKAVSVKLQGFSFQTNLFILLVAGCDMVLGIQWLQTLGPILWDFAELKIQFSFQSQKYVLQGI